MKETTARLLLNLMLVCLSFASSTVQQMAKFFLQVLPLLANRQDRIPYFTEEELIHRAAEMVTAILQSSQATRCHDSYRMNRELFVQLLELISPHLTETHLMPAHVQLAIFLDWIGHYPTIRTQQQTFKLSRERLMLARRSVRSAIMNSVYPQYVKFPTTIPNLTDNPKMKFFQGAYGCIDGSFFPLEMPAGEKENWRNRKNVISTNALLITDVENKLIFQYAMFGAEGSGGDSTVLEHALAKDLQLLPNGFLIGDAGYALSTQLLTPYRGVRYHLKEFSHLAAGRPQTQEELFNLRHSSFRNQVERAIGVLKMRFRILREPLRVKEKEEKWETYFACIALHNFIRVNNAALDCDLEDSLEENEVVNEGAVENQLGLLDNLHAMDWRREIATNMWNDYIH